MSDLFVLIGDETKLVNNFDNRFPLVIEIIPEAATFAPAKIQSYFPATKSVYRISDKKDGYVLTENGNYLLDLWFQSWPDFGNG